MQSTIVFISSTWFNL